MNVRAFSFKRVFALQLSHPLKFLAFLQQQDRDFDLLFILALRGFLFPVFGVKDSHSPAILFFN